jgi:5-methylcytosine-specific restriction endonuclease McrA
MIVETDDELEVNFGSLKDRNGATGLKRQALERDGFRCRQCEKSVNSKTSQANYIIPVKRFANVKQSQTSDNIQILCLKCHKKKTKYEIETKHENKV